MAAYAVTARISDVRPYRTSRRDESRATAAAVHASRSERLLREDDAIEFDGRDPDGPSWADLAIRFAETTFYLFDPQSWR